MASKSASSARHNAANQILKNMCEHSQQLVQQAVMVCAFSLLPSRMSRLASLRVASKEDNTWVELNTRREMYHFVFCINGSNYDGLSNFPKIFENSPNTVQKLYERFLSFFEMHLRQRLRVRIV